MGPVAETPPAGVCRTVGGNENRAGGLFFFFRYRSFTNAVVVREQREAQLGLEIEERIETIQNLQ